MKPYEPIRKSIIAYGIEFFATIILVFCAAICLTASTLVTLILVECAHFVYRGVYYGYFMHDEVKNNLKKFLSGVLPGLVAIIIFALLQKGLKDDDTKYVVSVITSIVTLAMIIPFIKPKSINLKHHDASSIVSNHNATSKQKSLYKLCTIFFRIFIILGFAIAIIMTLMLESYTTAIVVISIGCAFWAGRIAIALHCWWIDGIAIAQSIADGTDIVTSESCGDSETQSNEISNNSNSNNGESFASEREVYRIVKKIAERWSYRDDVSALVNEATIRYNVTVEIPYDQFINYTINGKISCRDDNESSAFTHLSGKMDKAAYKIKEETIRELGKLNLSQPYEIRVDVGSIERDR